jgi:glycosyltransferase involved in cell wall biosynthesis
VEPGRAELYQAFDLFALSSYREGLPNVLLEAMALEVPVVATRVAGIPRLIEDGVNGLLVEGGDSGSLAGAIARLLDDAALRARLGKTARQTIEARYSFQQRMVRIAGLYDRLLERPWAAS